MHYNRHAYRHIIINKYEIIRTRTTNNTYVTTIIYDDFISKSKDDEEHDNIVAYRCISTLEHIFDDSNVDAEDLVSKPSSYFRVDEDREPN